MTLALILFYLAGVSSRLYTVSGIILSVMIFATIGLVVGFLICRDGCKTKREAAVLDAKAKKGAKVWFAIFAFFMATLIFAPTKAFLYSLAGLQIAKTIAEQPVVQELGKETMEMVKNINRYLEAAIGSHESGTSAEED